jgi:hypothetical protein
MDSNRANPEFVILPFQARLTGDARFLSLAQVRVLRAHAAALQIERTYPDAPHAIGWTIFRRTPKAYVHEGEPLFHKECNARKYLRKVYAVHSSLVGESDALTYAHLEL